MDRANIRGPEDSKRSASDGIVALIVGSIRKLNPVKAGPTEKPVDYLIDVVARPEEPTAENNWVANPAHAQIESATEYCSDKHFKKVKERLAYLATQSGWLLEPAE